MYLDVLEQGFKDFFEKDVPLNTLKAEYLLPTHIGGLLRDGNCTVKALKKRISGLVLLIRKIKRLWWRALKS